MQVSNGARHRVALTGELAAGRTSILNRLTDLGFAESEQGTIGATFQRVCGTVNGEVVELRVWDTAGQERLRRAEPDPLPQRARSPSTTSRAAGPSRPSPAGSSRSAPSPAITRES